jgi:hypothetical protein
MTTPAIAVSDRITDRFQLRQALKRVQGLTERNRRESREVLCRKFLRDQQRAEVAQAKVCRDIINRFHDVETPEDIQERLIVLKLIPDVRVKARVKPKRKKRNREALKLRNKAKAMRRQGVPGY